MIEFKVPADNLIVLEEVADCLRRIAQRQQSKSLDDSNPFSEMVMPLVIPTNDLHFNDPTSGQVVIPAPPAATASEIPLPPVAAPVIPAPPVTAVPTPPPATGSVALDGEGLPWDQRIHASTKTKRQSDNTWKLIKGIDQALVAAVKAELRAAMGSVAPPPVYTPTAMPDPSLVVTPPPVIPAPPTAVTPPPAPATGPTFPELVQIVSKHMGDGTIAMIEVQDICKANGFAALPLVSNRPDMIPTILAQMEAVWSTRQPMLG